ncbi:MAG: hypothetical protein OQL11_12930 [Gammaproteobacteria bacterium]|nr:hypothetical protein [Gammaproteobacteria bacterium]
MTLIIDMASGTRCDEILPSPAGEDGSTNRLQAPAPQVEVGLHTDTTATPCSGMPASLPTGDLELFLDSMR